MSKAYLFAMFLLAASFTGCIGGDDLEELTTEEDEIIEPVGVDDNAGMPVVEFIGTVNDEGALYLIGSYYDDGYILSYSVESTNSNEEDEDYCEYTFGLYLKDENSTIEAEYDCYPIYYQTLFIELCYDLEHVDQTITAKIEDNDGNKASAEYELVEDDFDACEGYYYEDDYYEDTPIATFIVETSSSGEYYITVVKVTNQEDLTNFSFFLKDETGSTYVGGNGFGEIAMQMLWNEEHGIDKSYSDTCDDNCDSQLESRAANISADDGTYFPVHFNDNDRDGKLSAGDRFTVYGTGNSANGPAQDGWKLDIYHDPSGNIIGSGEIN